MRNTLTIAAAAMGLAGLGGCAAVRSTPVDLSDNVVRSGVQYSLPKGLLRVELVETGGGGMYLAISQPFFVGDADASYMLDGASGALANQNYYFDVNPRTRLLSFVDSTSEGQAAEIARRLASSAGGFNALQAESSAASASDSVIYSRIIDPLAGCEFAAACNFAAVNEALRQGALNHLRCTAGANAVKPALCERIMADPDFFRISMQPLFEARGPSADTTAADCSHAICYRAPVPYAISLRVAGATDRSEVVHLPNEAPAMALPVPAGVFATSSARIDLVHGMPGEYEVDRDNELVAVALLPLEVVRAGFRATAEVFKFRIDYNSDRQRFRDSEPDEPAPARSFSGDAAETSSRIQQEPDDDDEAQDPLFKVQLARDNAPAQTGSGQDLP